MRTVVVVVVLGVLVGSAAARADEPGGFPDRLGPSASIAIGAGYAFAEGESGGIAVLALADLGWFVTDRVAILAGATIAARPGDPAIHHTLWRLGVELRLDPRHYLRLSAGRSIVDRAHDEVASSEGFENIGKGEGALLVAGIPAAFWGWGELSFQVVAGGGLQHGDAEAGYAAFLATCLELAVR